MAPNCVRECLDWILGIVSLPKGLSWEVVESQSLEVFGKYADMVLKDRFYFFYF